MKTKHTPKASKPSLAEVAYQEIYRRIVSLEYAPGQALEEKMLMAHLNIGRTPVREALFRLSTEMLVESQPQKGFVVRPITLQSVRAMFEALQLLELGVAELAVRQQDVSASLAGMEAANRTVAETVQQNDIYGLVESNHEFHMILARCSGNEYLVRVMHEVRCEANRLSYLSFSHETGPGRSLHTHYDSVIRHHEDFIRYLAEKDEDRLRELICDHIHAFRMRVVSYLTS